jgi:SAM-dependent methyltransferase
MSTHPVSAANGGWTSAATLYIVRRVHDLAAGRKLAILDMGCGDGANLQALMPYGHDLYGYDLVGPDYIYDEPRRQRLGAHFGEGYDEHLRVTQSEREIPFPDASFDVVYANQVFEHVRFLDSMMAECARVLRPGGTLLANFPLATYPVEGHLGVPFAHWIPPGALRVRYLDLFSRLGRPRRLPGRQGWTHRQHAIFHDRYLREETFYRFLNEVQAVSTHYFESSELETGVFLRAKIDLLKTGGPRAQRRAALLERFDGPALHGVVTHLLNAAFCMRSPRR